MGADLGFVCVGLDWWPATKCNFDWCPWHNSSIWAIDLEEVKPYARLLSPFLLRIGGSLQDQYNFQPSCPGIEEQFPVDENNRLGFGGGCISKDRVAEVSTFCKEVGCELVWGLNAMHGRSEDGMGPWDSTNAKELLDFMVQIKTPLHALTLGNEVWGEMVHLSLDQALHAFSELNEIVDRLWDGDSKRPLIAGLDGYVNRYQLTFLSNFTAGIVKDETRVDVLNFHEYPLGTSKDNRTVDRALEHDVSFQHMAEKVASLALPNQQVWMSECGGSSDSGSPQATGSYASGFWYLDGMAMFHHAGYQRFCRQTLAGGNYGLLDQVSPRTPHPDFWNAVLYQKILGRPLTELTSQLEHMVRCEGVSEDPMRPTAQWYAFEAKNPTASRAFLGVNFHPSLRCGLVLHDRDDAPAHHIAEYILTPNAAGTEPNVTSTRIYLNGLELIDHSSPLEGRRTTEKILWLEPHTYGFYEVTDGPALAVKK